MESFCLWVLSMTVIKLLICLCNLKFYSFLNFIIFVQYLLIVNFMFFYYIGLLLKMSWIYKLHWSTNFNLFSENKMGPGISKWIFHAEHKSGVQNFPSRHVSKNKMCETPKTLFKAIYEKLLSWTLSRYKQFVFGSAEKLNTWKNLNDYKKE